MIRASVGAFYLGSLRGAHQVLSTTHYLYGVNPPLPNNEAERLGALHRYNILDTEQEEAYDDLTYIASQICDTPVSLISFVDRDRQWFKSRRGTPEGTTETSRSVAFCAYNILNPSEPLVVNNAHEDERFKDNPLVGGDTKVVFYAGAPLISQDGHALGSLCVIDHQPRDLTPEQIESLKRLSRQVVNLLEARRSLAESRHNHLLLQGAHQNLRDFSHTIAHDLKAPIRNIGQYLEIVDEEFGDQIPLEARELLNTVSLLADNTTKMVNGVLEYSAAVNQMDVSPQFIELEDLVRETAIRIGLPSDCELEFVGPVRHVSSSQIALQQIIQNLVGNAINFRDKPFTKVSIHCNRVKDMHHFRVVDNGPGISEGEQKAIFALFYSGDSGSTGHGVGLSIVKRLVEMLGGELSVSSNKGAGSSFNFTIRA